MLIDSLLSNGIKVLHILFILN